MSQEKEIIKFLKWRFDGFEKALEFHTKLNQPYDPIGASANEMLHAIMYNTRCKGSAGSGWDTVDKGESKYSNFLQFRICTSCDEKVMFFLNTCPECGGHDFKACKKDARWGLQAKTHLKYKDVINGYRLTLINPETYEPTCRLFNLRSWVVDPKNEYLTEYAIRQSQTKSNNINFQPLRQDFYLSSPCKHLDITIDIENDDIKINYFNIDNTTPEVIPDKFLNKDMETIMENKNFGKPRGDVSRD